MATVVLGVAPRLWSVVDRRPRPPPPTPISCCGTACRPAGAVVCTLAAGVGVFAVRRPLARVQAALAPPLSGTQVYDATVRGLLRGAGRLTGRVLSGSLPVYVTVILLTATVSPAVALLTGRWWPGWPAAVAHVADAAIAALLAVGAVAATVPAGASLRCCCSASSATRCDPLRRPGGAGPGADAVR